MTAAWEWSGIVLGLAVIQAVAGVLRHRVAVACWLYASFRSMQLLGRHSAEVGVAIRRKLPTGEVVSAATNDALMIGGAFDVSARLSGAIVSYLIVGVLLLRTSGLIGTLVLVGVPLMVILLGPLMHPLQERQKVQRAVTGQLTAQVLLPGIFLVSLTWLGARLAIEGRLSVGDIVAFYGYAFFLVVPIRTAIESADKFTRSLVGAARIIGVLETRPEISEPDDPAAPPPAGSVGWSMPKASPSAMCPSSASPCTRCATASSCRRLSPGCSPERCATSSTRGTAPWTTAVVGPSGAGKSTWGDCSPGSTRPAPDV